MASVVLPIQRSTSTQRGIFLKQCHGVWLPTPYQRHWGTQLQGSQNSVFINHNPIIKKLYIKQGEKDKHVYTSFGWTLLMVKY